MKWFVYILECQDGSLYTGITTNVEARFVKHKLGIGAKYTRSHPPVKIVYTEEKINKSQATKRELEIKSLSRDQKLVLIEN